MCTIALQLEDRAHADRVSCRLAQVESAVAVPPLENSLSEPDWQAHLAAEQAQREAEQAAAAAAEKAAKEAEEAARITQQQAEEAAARQEQLQRVRAGSSCGGPWNVYKCHSWQVHALQHGASTMSGTTSSALHGCLLHRLGTSLPVPSKTQRLRRNHGTAV